MRNYCKLYKKCSSKDCSIKDEQRVQNFYWKGDKAKSWSSLCMTCHKKSVDCWRKQNKDLYSSYIKTWQTNNPKKMLASSNKNKLKRLQAVPSWLTIDQSQQIQQFYKNCPEGHHVDHIVPINGKEVRGLHVPWNLQYLPALENMKKGNRV